MNENNIIIYQDENEVTRVSVRQDGQGVAEETGQKDKKCSRKISAALLLIYI